MMDPQMSATSHTESTGVTVCAIRDTVGKYLYAAQRWFIGAILWTSLQLAARHEKRRCSDRVGSFEENSMKGFGKIAFEEKLHGGQAVWRARAAWRQFSVERTYLLIKRPKNPKP